MADFMVPPLEPSEYLQELRNHHETVSRERCEQQEVHPPGLSGHGPVERSEQEESFPEGSVNLGTPLGPAFHIPMTQGHALEELPSQIDIEWPHSMSPVPAPTLRSNAVAPPTDPEVHEFVEVAQIAHEAVVHATQQRAEAQEASHSEATEDADAPTTSLID